MGARRVRAPSRAHDGIRIGCLVAWHTLVVQTAPVTNHLCAGANPGQLGTIGGLVTRCPVERKLHASVHVLVLLVGGAPRVAEAVAHWVVGLARDALTTLLASVEACAIGCARTGAGRIPVEVHLIGDAAALSVGQHDAGDENEDNNKNRLHV